MITKFKHIALMSVCLMSSAVVFAQQNNSKSNMNMNGQPNQADQTPHEESQVNIFGDFLWWKGQVEGTEYAQRETDSTSVTDPLAVRSFKTQKTDGKYRPGFRVGLGYRFKQDNTNDFDAWDITAIWTWMKARSSNFSCNNTCGGDDSSSSSGSGSNGTLVGLFKPTGLSTLGPSATTAFSQWHLKMNLIDLVAGREYRPARKIVLKPHAGLRGAFFKFNQNQCFTGLWNFYGPGTAGSPAPTPVPGSLFQLSSATTANSHFKYDAIGIKMGSDADWQFSDHFSFVGKLGGSLLYGKYKAHQEYVGFNANAVNQGQPLLVPSDNKFSNDMWRVRANVEAFIGLMYETTFANDDCGFALSAGWEVSEWFQLNEIPHVRSDVQDFRAFDAAGLPSNAINYYHTEVADHGNVSFQGLTVRASFDF